MFKIKYTPENIIALIGIILIQFALIPSHINGHFPDISLPLLIFAGLLCYLYKAIIDKDPIYILSNAIGLTLNGLMIIRILMGGWDELITSRYNLITLGYIGAPIFARYLPPYIIHNFLSMSTILLLFSNNS